MHYHPKHLFREPCSILTKTRIGNLLFHQGTLSYLQHLYAGHIVQADEPDTYEHLSVSSYIRARSCDFNGYILCRLENLNHCKFAIRIT